MCVMIVFILVMFDSSIVVSCVFLCECMMMSLLIVFLLQVSIVLWIVFVDMLFLVSMLGQCRILFVCRWLMFGNELSIVCLSLVSWLSVDWFSVFVLMFCFLCCRLMCMLILLCDSLFISILCSVGLYVCMLFGIWKLRLRKCEFMVCSLIDMLVLLLLVVVMSLCVVFVQFVMLQIMVCFVVWCFCGWGDMLRCLVYWKVWGGKCVLFYFCGLFCWVCLLFGVKIGVFFFFVIFL